MPHHSRRVGSQEIFTWHLLASLESRVWGLRWGLPVHFWRQFESPLFPEGPCIWSNGFLTISLKLWLSKNRKTLTLTIFRDGAMRTHFWRQYPTFFFVQAPLNNPLIFVFVISNQLLSNIKRKSKFQDRSSIYPKTANFSFPCYLRTPYWIEITGDQSAR